MPSLLIHWVKRPKGADADNARPDAVEAGAALACHLGLDTLDLFPIQKSESAAKLAHSKDRRARPR